jgi:thiamine monophosphate synthase
MLLFGHRFISSPRFYHIDDIDSIVHTPPNSLLFLTFHERNLDIIEHMRLNNLHFGLGCHSLTEVVYANALGAAYIIVDKVLAKDAQNAAENYLFDAKILVQSDSEEDIEEIAEQGIDGILFPEGVIKISG